MDIDYHGMIADLQAENELLKSQLKHARSWFNWLRDIEWPELSFIEKWYIFCAVIVTLIAITYFVNAWMGLYDDD